MIYPVLTVIVGSIVVLISGISLFRCLRDGGIFVNQVRFLVSGMLLVFHFPLTRFLDGLILPWLEKVGAVEGNDIASYWISMALIVAIQMIIVPTGRELYVTYMADRITRSAV